MCTWKERIIKVKASHPLPTVKICIKSEFIQKMLRYFILFLCHKISIVWRKSRFWNQCSTRPPSVSTGLSVPGVSHQWCKQAAGRGGRLSVADSLDRLPGLLFSPSSGLVCCPSHLITLTAPSLSHTHWSSFSVLHAGSPDRRSYTFILCLKVNFCKLWWARVCVSEGRKKQCCIVVKHVSCRKLWLCPHRCWGTVYCRGCP